MAGNLLQGIRYGRKPVDSINMYICKGDCLFGFIVVITVFWDTDLCIIPTGKSSDRFIIIDNVLLVVTLEL